MRLSLLITLLVMPAMAIAQNAIEGSVVIEQTITPVPGASVFINNTSIGTIAGQDGGFKLVNIPNGKYELVVSAVGYETIVYAIQKLPMTLRIELKQKIAEMENVTVGGYITETWEKWGRLFLESFLGENPVAKKCVLKNKEVIRFRYYKKKKMLQVVADAPLKIDNPELGYIIQYDLQDFSIHFGDHSTYYAGYALFSDKKNSQKKAIRKNRQATYLGSSMHFMRSVYSKTTTGDGFSMRPMQRINNLEKQRVRQILRSRVQAGIEVLAKIKDTLSVDSNAYYQNVMRQKDYEDIYGNTIAVDSILNGESAANKIVFWNNYLYVTYSKAMEAPEYLEFIGESRKPMFQSSLLLLTLGKPLLIDANGNWSPPDNIQSSGYWGWSDKVGTMLPLDYEP